LLPSREPERILDLQLCDGTVLCAQRGASSALVYAQAASGPWLELPDYARAPARVLSERGQLGVYFVVERGSKTLLVRGLLSDRAAKPVLVAELPSDAGALLALEGVSQGATTTLQLATERGWYRVIAVHEGLPA
jgi:hypothetical protein